jgi:hypothetical protein
MLSSIHSIPPWIVSISISLPLIVQSLSKAEVINVFRGFPKRVGGELHWKRFVPTPHRGTSHREKLSARFADITGKMDHGKLRSLRHCPVLSEKPNRIEPRSPPCTRRSSYVLGFGKETNTAHSGTRRGFGTGSRLIELAGNRRPPIGAVMMANWLSVTGVIEGGRPRTGVERPWTGETVLLK